MSHPLAECIPRNDRVLVRREPPAIESAGGLILPESAQERQPNFVTVVAVGPGRMLPTGKRLKIDLTPGQRVLIASHAALDLGSPFSDNDGEYVMLSEEDILGEFPA